MYFQDESRFGLFTRNGKTLTAKGVKPICRFHHIFKSIYLFGAFSPIDGDSLLLEMPNCNSETFQIFLNELSARKADTYNIVVVDNAPFHKAANLKIPENIVLIFLPPYSPELNPAEKMWAEFKRKFTNNLYNSLEEIGEFITKTIKDLKAEM